MNWIPCMTLGLTPVWDPGAPVPSPTRRQRDIPRSQCSKVEAQIQTRVWELRQGRPHKWDGEDTDHGAPDDTHSWLYVPVPSPVRTSTRTTVTEGRVRKQTRRATDPGPSPHDRERVVTRVFVDSVEESWQLYRQPFCLYLPVPVRGYWKRNVCVHRSSTDVKKNKEISDNS